MIIERYPNELKGVTYNLVVLKPQTYTAAKKYPLLIVLVGIGAKGDDIKSLENDIPPNIKLAPDSDDFVIVAVQTPDTYDDEVSFALNWAFANLSVSPNDGVYGYGFSYGAMGIWKFIAANLTQAKMFDAVVPVATGWTEIPENGWQNIAAAGVGIWAFHNLKDDNPGTPVGATNSYVDSVNAAKPGLATKTIFNASGHGGWNEAANTVSPPYATGGQGLTSPNLTIFKWFKQNTRTRRVAPSSNVIPASGVLAKGTALISNGQIFLDGSASTGYDNISWTDVSDTKSTWVGGTGWKTAISKPTKSGTYKFQLKATKGSVSDIQTITVDFQTDTQPIPPEPVFKPSHILHFKDGTQQEVRIESL